MRKILEKFMRHVYKGEKFKSPFLHVRFSKNERNHAYTAS